MEDYFDYDVHITHKQRFEAILLLNRAIMRARSENKGNEIFKSPLWNAIWEAQSLIENLSFNSDLSTYGELQIMWKYAIEGYERVIDLLDKL